MLMLVVRLVVVASYLRHIMLPLVVTVACELWLWLFTQSRLTVKHLRDYLCCKSPISSLHSLMIVEIWSNKATHTTFFIIVDGMISCEQIKAVKVMLVNDLSESYVTPITTNLSIVLKIIYEQVPYLLSSKHRGWVSC